MNASGPGSNVGPSILCYCSLLRCGADGFRAWP